ncbi:hypothetical protein ABZU75_39990 [Streptosporangium sp. NPDC005286]|uniref:hypothetical protein n=1 Tax=Streptosporangium sp. NPDC005286 TaxID=3154463 RepID=UPI0033AF8B9A
MNNRPEPTEPHKRPEPPKIHDQPETPGVHGRPEPPEPHDRPQLAEIHDWPELREIRDGIPPPPGPEIVRAALMRAALDGLETPAAPEPSRRPPPSRRTSSPHVAAAVRGLHRAWALLAMEARLLNPAIWLASALIMVVGVSFVLAGKGHADFTLALTAPLIAMAGVAGSCGPEHDDAFELVAVTPTSPRVIMMARMTLVFGYDLLLALLASAVLAPLNAAPVGLASLIIAWLGPMAALAGLSLLLSVCWNPGGAMGGGLAVWALYALTATDVPVPDGFRNFWTTSPATVGLALALMLAAVIAAGMGEPIRRAHATHRS